MTRLHGVKLARPADQDFSDLTNARKLGPAAWVPDEADVLDLPFDREPTEVEQVRIRRRLATANAAEEAQVTTWAEQRAALRRLKGLSPPLTAVVPAVIGLLPSTVQSSKSVSFGPRCGAPQMWPWISCGSTGTSTNRAPHRRGAAARDEKLAAYGE